MEGVESGSQRIVPFLLIILEGFIFPDEVHARRGPLREPVKNVLADFAR